VTYESSANHELRAAGKAATRRDSNACAEGPSGCSESACGLHQCGGLAGLHNAGNFTPCLRERLSRPKDPRIGTDVAGTVVTVGKETEFQAGDAVFGVSPGSFAEYTRNGASKFALKPRNLSFAEAAAVPAAAFTALQGLRDKGQIRAGQKVLIDGASGGVGIYAVQLAKAFGAEVTAVYRCRIVGDKGVTSPASPSIRAMAQFDASKFALPHSQKGTPQWLSFPADVPAARPEMLSRGYLSSRVSARHFLQGQNWLGRGNWLWPLPVAACVLSLVPSRGVLIDLGAYVGISNWRRRHSTRCSFRQSLWRRSGGIASFPTQRAQDRHGCGGYGGGGGQGSDGV
jgi:hypothetical protein